MNATLEPLPMIVRVKVRSKYAPPPASTSGTKTRMGLLGALVVRDDVITPVADAKCAAPLWTIGTMTVKVPAVKPHVAEKFTEVTDPVRVQLAVIAVRSRMLSTYVLVAASVPVVGVARFVMRWLFRDTEAVGAAIWSRRLVRTWVSKLLTYELVRVVHCTAEPTVART